MSLKHYIALIITAICLCSTARAQLVFESTEWDFGAVKEAGGRVSHTFAAVNRGNKPLVILDVTTTCGCTVPAFSRKPVAPGGRTEITVTFDPMNRPGSFRRTLNVYSSERSRLATLTISGEVTPRTKSVEELYPVDAGGGLRLESALCAFSYIYTGRRVASAVGIVNTSNRRIRLALRGEDASGVLSTEYPSELAPGQRSAINVAYLIPSSKPRYGTVRDALRIVVDDRATATLLVVHGIGVDFWSEKEKQMAPVASFSENMLKFGVVKHAAPVQRMTLTLSNTGRGDLVVRAVENDGRITTTLAPGQRIAPGRSRRVEVLLDPKQQEFGTMSDHLVIITNDPTRPMRRIRVTAVIED